MHRNRRDGQPQPTPPLPTHPIPPYPPCASLPTPRRPTHPTVPHRSSNERATLSSLLSGYPAPPPSQPRASRASSRSCEQGVRAGGPVYAPALLPHPQDHEVAGGIGDPIHEAAEYHHPLPVALGSVAGGR